MKLRNIAFALILASGAAFAQSPVGAGWVRLTTTSVTDVFLDPALVSRMGDRVTLWQRTEFREGRTGDRDWDVALERLEMNCAARTTDLLSYSLHGRDGALVRGNDVPADMRQANPVRSGSVAETVLEYVCSRH